MPKPPTSQPEAARPPAISRRGLVYGVFGAIVMLGLGGLARVALGNTRLLRPPGGQDEQHFQATCIKCDRCRSVCPRSAISLAGIEHGLINARLQFMEFRKSRIADTVPESSAQTINISHAQGMQRLTGLKGSNFCDFCNLCIESCPTGALVAFNPASERLGLAILDSYLCIAFNKQGGCRKCVDYCMFGAISLDADKRQVVDAAKCNGCGVCENICPSNTYRSYQGSSKRGINIEVVDGVR